MVYQEDKRGVSEGKPEAQAAGAVYAIHAMASPITDDGFLGRLIWPEGRVHSYLQLTAESAQGLRQTIAELHFTSKDAAGMYVNTSRKVMNMLTIASGLLGLEKPFMKLTEKWGLSNRMAHLKAVQTSERTAKEGVTELARITGQPGYILKAWNRACQAGLIINHAELPFMPVGTVGHGPINCHAGTRTVMHFMGEKFRQVAQTCKQFDGENLKETIPFLKMLMPDSEQIRAIDFEELEAERKILGQRLYETGCMMRMATRKETPRKSGTFIP